MEPINTHELRFHDYRIGANHNEVIFAGGYLQCSDKIKDIAKDQKVRWSSLISNGGYSIVDLEAERQAKIKRAAPELLEALQAMKIHFHSWLMQDKNTIGYKHATKALAAIKKATE